MLGENSKNSSFVYKLVMQQVRKPTLVEATPFLHVLYLGPPASGKSERAKRTAKYLGFEMIEVSDELKRTQDSEVLRYIANGDLVPDPVVNRVLLDKLAERSTSRVICGSARSADQARDLYYFLCQRMSRVTVIDGMRSFDECQALHMIRKLNENRVDDHSASIEDRFTKYYSNIERVRSFFRSHIYPQNIHQVTFTDDIDSDCQNILSKIQSTHSESFSMPNMVSAGQ
jgi:adenylate kinase family enzyme